MTEEEFSALFDGEEQALLGELSDTLKATPSLELPSDFARRTAEAAEQRFARLSGLTKLAVRLEPVIKAPVASAQAFPWTLALLTGTAGAGFLGQQSAGNFGLGLLALLLFWAALSFVCLPDLKVRERSQSSIPTALFYLLPLLCVLATSVFCGGIVSALGLFSINFRSAGWNVILLGPAAGVATALFMLSTLKGSWRALGDHSVGRPRWLFPVQILHALWLATLTSIFQALWDPHARTWIPWATSLGIGLLVSVLLSLRKPVVEEGRPALWRALHKALRSLVIGLAPVAVVLFGAYEAALTRRVEQPELIEGIRREVAEWVAAQQAIPAAQNGWTVVGSDFINRDPRKSALMVRLKAGGVLYDKYMDGGKRPAPADLQKARREFLLGLSLLESALARPQFSYIATQGFSAQSFVPNFLAARSASRGLSALVREAVEEGRTEEGLRYLKLGLDWSTRLREGGLISLMISGAQASIALENVERWVFLARPNRQQLAQLAEALNRSRPAPELWLATMRREIYMCDKAFRELPLADQSSTPLQAFGQDEGHWKVLVRILPRSYWESEHKAYLNVQLSSLGEWESLGRPSNTDAGEYLPFSYTARQMIPNSGRAQSRFLWSLAQFEALRTVVALERYKLDHGIYPEGLDSLVPQYLPELPRNAVSVNVWARKPVLGYQRKNNAYELVCQSPVLSTIQLKPRQLFGPDGHYEVDKLSP